MNQRLLHSLLMLLFIAAGVGTTTGFAQSIRAAPDAAASPAFDASPAALEAENKIPHGEQNRDAIETASSSSPASHMLDRLSNTVSGSYTVGAEDVLDVTVWRNQDLSKQVQVRPDGRISLPVIRDVLAVGKTPTQLADEITKRLKAYVQNPVVAVSVVEVNSYSVFVLGEVARPGKYHLKSKTTLLQGITMAGGFTPIAARNLVVVFRFSSNGNGSGTQTLSASYDDIVLRGGIQQNIELRAGDTIVVPSEAMVVFPGQQ